MRDQCYVVKMGEIVGVSAHLRQPVHCHIYDLGPVDVGRHTSVRMLSTFYVAICWFLFLMLLIVAYCMLLSVYLGKNVLYCGFVR